MVAVTAVTGGLLLFRARTPGATIAGRHAILTILATRAQVLERSVSALLQEGAVSEVLQYTDGGRSLESGAI